MMFSWFKNSNKPNTIEYYTTNTKHSFKNYSKDVGIVDVNQKFKIIPVNLWSKLVSFISGKDSLTLFIELDVTTITDGKRKHQVSVLIPYIKDMKWVDIKKQSVKVYCNCTSFMFHSAYILNESGNVLLDESRSKRLNIGLTKPPLKNSTTSPLCKHCYKTLTMIDKLVKEI